MTVVTQSVGFTGSAAGLYSDAPNGSQIVKQRGRLFLGAGTDAWSGYTYSAGVTDGTWLFSSSLETDHGLRYLEKGAQLVAGSKAGAVAGLFFTRQSDNSQLSSDPVPIGVGSVAWNDVVGTRGVWGKYTEAYRNQGAGPAIGHEIEVVNFGTETTTLTPYGVVDGTGTSRTLAYGLGIGCGAGNTSPTRNDATAAIYITPNSKRFRAGLVFLYTAITRDTPGDETTPAPAILFGRGQEIRWMYSVGAASRSGTIRSDIGTTGQETRIIFAAGGLEIRDAIEAAIVQFAPGPKIGFFGTAGVTKETGVLVTAAAIHAALVRLGLFAA